MYILIGILIFGFLIVIHETGHFVVAKACGIKVNEFSIGIGPRLLHRKGKETEFSLRLLPLMAYVAMEGEGQDSSDPRSFGRAAWWKRLAVLCAGSFANLLTGLVILVIMYAGVNSFATTTLTGFAPGFPCQGEEMLLPGDKIVSIDGKAVLLQNDVGTLLGMSRDGSVDMVIERNGELLKRTDLPLIPREYEENGQKSLRYGLNFAVEEATLPVRLRTGFFYAVDFARMTWWSLEMLVTGGATAKDLRGPVGIVGMMNDVGRASPTVMDAILNLLYLGAFIAINLGVMNLMPFPALDGGQILFLLLSEVGHLLTGRWIPAKFQQYVNAAGLFALLGLMLFVVVQDVFRLIQG